MGFMAAMAQFFERHPGQSALDFGREILRLTYEEKMVFWTGLQAHIPCDPPAQPKNVG